MSVERIDKTDDPLSMFFRAYPSYVEYACNILLRKHRIPHWYHQVEDFKQELALTLWLCCQNLRKGCSLWTYFIKCAPGALVVFRYREPTYDQIFLEFPSEAVFTGKLRDWAEHHPYQRPWYFKIRKDCCPEWEDRRHFLRFIDQTYPNAPRTIESRRGQMIPQPKKLRPNEPWSPTNFRLEPPKRQFRGIKPNKSGTWTVCHKNKKKNYPTEQEAKEAKAFAIVNGYLPERAVS